MRKWLFMLMAIAFVTISACASRPPQPIDTASQAPPAAEPVKQKLWVPGYWNQQGVWVPGKWEYR